MEQIWTGTWLAEKTRKSVRNSPISIFLTPFSTNFLLFIVSIMKFQESLLQWLIPYQMKLTPTLLPRWQKSARMLRPWQCRPPVVSGFLIFLYPCCAWKFNEIRPDEYSLLSPTYLSGTFLFTLPVVVQVSSLFWKRIPQFKPAS